jgi:LPPG:FO 2-phospho-L-lactate transferase
MSVVAISGGVGGAKLALGLHRILPPGDLTVVVNTGDDFDHLGLKICPDLDTVLYTLADIGDQVQGWGRRDETWTLMQTLKSLGEETWFKLGDADTALHIARTHRLNGGSSLSEVIDHFRTQFGIASRILPMTDETVQTRIVTDEGEMAFQDYFVRRRCEPRAHSIRFVRAAESLPAPGVAAALTSPALEAIVLCPSNPYLSIDPILAIERLRRLLEQRGAPLIAVSPLIGATAVKGPTTKIMQELGIPLTPTAIFEHYRGLVDALVVDSVDAGAAGRLPVPIFSTATLMRSLDDRLRLARFVLDCARTLPRPASVKPFSPG